MMPVVARHERRPLRPAPAGLHPAVCVDVVDLGVIEHPQYGARHQVEFRWQIDKKDPDTGRPFVVIRRFTLSLYEKSNLRPFLESWRGEPFTEDEVAAGVDLEAEYLGRPCYLQVMHRQFDDRIYAHPMTALPLPEGFAPPVVRDYVRVVDRQSDGGE